MKHPRIEAIEARIEPLRKALAQHHLYNRLQTIEDVALFTEQHVFAVWDFMSLLKSLQGSLSCVSVPWVPAPHPQITRFINEIVWGEESDLDVHGKPNSHYVMYLEAMKELGASTQEIEGFVRQIAQGVSVQDALKAHAPSDALRAFVDYTFSVINTGKSHCVASAFTFGREDLLPEVFIQILEESKNQGRHFVRFNYYLERHIEVDGGEHGPIALEMIAALCGDDEEKWKEAEEVAVRALEVRLALWTGIAEHLQMRNVVL